MEKKTDTNSYRSMLKGTSMMGGVQIFKILISLVRSKFVAIFLGPDGMGISSLFTTASNMITQVSGLGTELAVTKEVSQTKEDIAALHTTAAVAGAFRHFAAWCALIFCIVASPWLSLFTFGDYSYWWQFMLLGIAVMALVESAGYSAILQGLRRIKSISIASIAGAALGLVLGVPLYYFFGTKGIVPAMIVMTATTMFWLRHETKKAMLRPSVKFNLREHRPEMKRLLIMGVVLISAPLISSFCQYLLNIIIRTWGSLGEVGLYSAANSITNQYAGLVFSAMAVDYFPRLAAVAADNTHVTELANRQTELVAFVMAPIVILVVIFTPFVIDILLTPNFAPAIPLIRWMSVGVLLKAASFPLGYIAFAKDNRRLFFWMESVGCNLLFIVMSALGFHFFGIMGLGYSMVAEYSIVLTLYYLINRFAYGFRYNFKALQAVAVALCLGGAALLLTLAPPSPVIHMLLGACFLASATYSWLRLSSLLKRR